VPLTEIANAAYTDPRQRQLFKNIIYVGALSVLLDVDAEVFETCLPSNTRARSAMLDSNVQALHLGRNYVKEHMQAPWVCGCSALTTWVTKFLQTATALPRLGLVYGGATVAAWYPITPVDLDSRGVSEILRQIPYRPRHGPAPLCHRAG
jgi:2-oxoglutarate ferredoxin oxidoreductase subunit alpha